MAALLVFFLIRLNGLLQMGSNLPFHIFNELVSLLFGFQAFLGGISLDFASINGDLGKGTDSCDHGNFNDLPEALLDLTEVILSKISNCPKIRLEHSGQVHIHHISGIFSVISRGNHLSWSK